MPVPNSPHSDTAVNPYSFAGSKHQLLAGQMNRRPLSVPPQSSAEIDVNSDANGRQSYVDANAYIASDFNETSKTKPQKQTVNEAQDIVNSGNNFNCSQQQFIMGQQRHLKSQMHLNEPGMVIFESVKESAINKIDDLTTSITTAAKVPMLNEMNNGANVNSPMLTQQLRQTNPASISGLSDSPLNTDHINQSPSKAVNKRLIGAEEQQQLLQTPRSAQQQHEEETQQHELDCQRYREPIILDCHSLTMGMLPQDDEPSPLEQFLIGTTLLTRLKNFFDFAAQETQSREKGKINLPIWEMHWSDQILTVILPSYILPIIGSAFAPSVDSFCVQQQQPTQIRMQLLICPRKFRLINNIEYSGPNCPSESDVRIFERFFANKVTLINNEMAVFAYINFCRLSSPLIFNAIAQLMLIQMEPHHYNYLWHIEIELLHTEDESQQHVGNSTNSNPCGTSQKGITGESQKMVRYSIVVNEGFPSKQFLFCIYLWPSSAKSDAKLQIEGHRFYLRYNVERNDLFLFNQQQAPPSEIEQRVASILKKHGELVQKQQTELQKQQCSIWPCIRALLEGL